MYLSSFSLACAKHVFGNSDSIFIARMNVEILRCLEEC